MSAVADALLVGVCANDRRALAKAITLIESERAEDVATRLDVLAGLPPQSPGRDTRASSPCLCPPRR